PLCRLYLLNDDELEGRLTSCDAEKVLLDTWYGGLLTIPRKVVRAIIPVSSNKAVVYEGPTGLEGWIAGKMANAIANPGNWRYKNGAFYATRPASLARDLKLPDVANIEFDLAWKGMLYLAIAL